MRTKDEVLEDAKNDIITTGVGVPKELWMEYRKLEVLVEIRDIVYRGFTHLIGAIESLKDKP